MKNLCIGILLSITGTAVSILLFLAPLEIWLRVSTEPSSTPGMLRTNYERRKELVPLFQGWTYDAPVKINSYGFRDYERSPSDNAFRVVVLGDSITFGYGVPIDATFPKVLERLMSNYLGAKKVEVYNLGVGSYNTVAEFRYLKDVYKILKPELVIVEFTSGNDTYELNNGDEFINKSSGLRLVKDVLRRFYFYDYLANKIHQTLYQFRTRNIQNKYDARVRHDSALYDEDFVGWREAKDAFHDFVRFANEHHIALVFAIQANNVGLGQSLDTDPMKEIVLVIQRALRDAGVRHTVLLDDFFRSYVGNEQSLWVKSYDSHFSVLAHDLAGRGLFEYLLTEGLMPSTGADIVNK